MQSQAGRDSTFAGLAMDFRCCRRIAARDPASGQAMEATSKLDCLTRCRGAPWCAFFTWDPSAADSKCWLNQRPDYVDGLLSPSGYAGETCSKLSMAGPGRRWPAAETNGAGDCAMSTLLAHEGQSAATTTTIPLGIKGAVWRRQVGGSRVCEKGDVQCLVPPQDELICAQPWALNAAQEASGLYPGWRCSVSSGEPVATPVTAAGSVAAGSGNDADTAAAREGTVDGIDGTVLVFVAVLASLCAAILIAGALYGVWRYISIQDNVVVIGQRDLGRQKKTFSDGCGPQVSQEWEKVRKSLRDTVRKGVRTIERQHRDQCCGHCGCLAARTAKVVPAAVIQDNSDEVPQTTNVDCRGQPSLSYAHGGILVDLQLARAASVARESVKMHVVLRSWARLSSPTVVPEGQLVDPEGYNRSRAQVVFDSWTKLPAPDRVPEAETSWNYWTSGSQGKRLAEVVRSWTWLSSPAVCPQARDGRLVETAPSRLRSVFTSWTHLPWPPRVIGGVPDPELSAQHPGGDDGQLFRTSGDRLSSLFGTWRRLPVVQRIPEPSLANPGDSAPAWEA